MNDNNMSYTDFQVLEMFAGRREFPPQPSALVNNCAEWLADEGYLDIKFKGLTTKGKAFLKEKDNESADTAACVSCAGEHAASTSTGTASDSTP